FAVYPFAAELFRQSDIPKRLIPGTIALGAFTFTMDALPGTPQIQNIIPSGFFGTNAWAAPWLGTLGGVFIPAVGLAYLECRARGRRLRHRVAQRTRAVPRRAPRASAACAAAARARGRQQQVVHGPDPVDLRHEPQLRPGRDRGRGAGDAGSRARGRDLGGRRRAARRHRRGARAGLEA